MQVGVEVLDVVLENYDVGREESHLDEVAKTHGLEPDTKGELVGPDVPREVTTLVEAPLRLEVLLTAHGVVEQVVVGSGVLKDGAANVDTTAPSVLDNSIGHICLHDLVQLQARHEVNRAVVFQVSLSQHQAHLVRLVDVLEHEHHARSDAFLKDLYAQVCQRKRLLDARKNL